VGRPAGAFCFHDARVPADPSRETPATGAGVPNFDLGLVLPPEGSVARIGASNMRPIRKRGAKMSPNKPAAAGIAIQEILRNAIDGVFVLDRQRRYLLFNEACERITGYSSTELINTECCCRDVMDCRDEYGRPLSSALCPVKSLFAGAARSALQRMCLRRKDGSQVWVETAYTPVSNGTGEVEFVLGIIRNMTDAKLREDGLRQQFSKACKKLRQFVSAEQLEAEFGPSYEEPSLAQRCCGGTTMAGSAAAGGNARGSLTLDPILADVEREAIRRALRAANWQRNKAAQLMGISRSRLYRRMEALGINPNERG
jgi:transcriptional regulator with PAS, ATPase and Fis domain